MKVVIQGWIGSMANTHVRSDKPICQNHGKVILRGDNGLMMITRNEGDLETMERWQAGIFSGGDERYTFVMTRQHFESLLKIRACRLGTFNVFIVRDIVHMVLAPLSRPVKGRPSCYVTTCSRLLHGAF